MPKYIIFVKINNYLIIINIVSRETFAPIELLFFT